MRGFKSYIPDHVVLYMDNVLPEQKIGVHLGLLVKWYNAPLSTECSRFDSVIDRFDCLLVS